MTTLQKRGTSVIGTSGTTWASTANAIDGTPGASTNTYATWTNGTSGGVGYIELGGFDFSSIPANAVISSITILLRHYESNTTNVASLVFRPYNGTTARGSGAFTCTKASSVRNDSNSSNWTTVTLAMLQAADFRVRATFTHYTNTTSVIGRIDHVDITVVYTVPPGVASAPTVVSVADRLNITSPAAYPSDTVSWDMYEDAGSGYVSVFTAVALNSTKARTILDPTKSYSYRMRSINGALTTDGDAASGVPNPATPQFSLVTGIEQVTVNITRRPYVASYKIYRDTVLVHTSASQVANGTYSWTDTGLTGGVSYDYTTVTTAETPTSRDSAVSLVQSATPTSSTPTSTSVNQFALSDPGVVDDTLGDVTFEVTGQTSTGTSVLTTDIYENGSLVQSFTDDLTNAWQTFSHTITNAITNYANLEVRFSGLALGGIETRVARFRLSAPEGESIPVTEFEGWGVSL